ncbi:hypothetical protein EVAR_58928_1 [Eumeta japonica]|uniref:Uncharacterized protein n=1 Tax=Eumeta variegata TaxID=151549 RepID=A0A4C1Y6K7_EUMVA|nr:hypothetical protein EVAR_58928_1 [Eumeta japonica]
MPKPLSICTVVSAEHPKKQSGRSVTIRGQHARLQKKPPADVTPQSSIDAITRTVVRRYMPAAARAPRRVRRRRGRVSLRSVFLWLLVLRILSTTPPGGRGDSFVGRGTSSEDVPARRILYCPVRYALAS